MGERQNQQNQSSEKSPSAVSGLGDSQASRQQGGGLRAGQEHQQDSTRGAQQGGQQGGQSDARQQRQFDQGGGQQGGSPGDNRFAEHIREHQEVIDDSGRHVGTVDHIEGDRIKLARSDASDGKHHYVLLSQVAGIEGGKVRLRERGDNDFGQEAG